MAIKDNVVRGGGLLPRLVDGVVASGGVLRMREALDTRLLLAVSDNRSQPTEGRHDLGDRRVRPDNGLGRAKGRRARGSLEGGNLGRIDAGEAETVSSR